MASRFLRTLSLTSAAFAAVGPTGLAAQAPAKPAASAPKPAPAPMMASVDPTLFRGLKYRLVGHSVGGRATTVTGVPSEPKTFYMGVASGGVFKTTDGGVSWNPITDGKVPLGSSGSIAVAASNEKVVYLGTGSDGVRSNVSTGRGVYKSTDAGATWNFAGLYNVGQIGAVRIHPTNPDIVWVAAYGDIFKPSSERGIYKTTDGGKSWKKTLFVSDSTGAMDVEIQPGNPNVLFAWMNRIERKPWTIISGSREGGFYKSTDGGETWTRGMNGLPKDLIGKANLGVTAANPQRIYALVEALPGGGLYRSDDAGANWTLMNSNGALLQRPFYYTTLGTDPSNADVVYAGAESFFKSTDGGKTMVTMRTPHGDNHDIWVNPNNSNTMVQSNDGGANVSFDGGRTWSTQRNQPTAEFYGIATDNAFPYRIYAAQQDNSTYIFSSLSDPFVTEGMRVGPGCETGPILPHPSNKDLVYGSCKGQFSIMSFETGQSRNYWVGGQSLYGNAGQDLIFRFQRVSPMTTSPHDPSIIYYGSQYLHRSRDKGVTWEKMSPDLTAFPKCCQGASGEPITRDVTGEEFYSTLYAISESPKTAGVIWTGANDGPFHVTRDNGKTWKNITPKDLPTGGRVAWIDASPHKAGTAYYAAYRYLLGDYAPYLYRTDDYGATWTKLTDGKNGIPADAPTRVVREDPVRPGLLYAGTEFGLYISFDNGGHWQPFELNMPKVPINDIRIKNGDLVVATQGRAMWILDNISSLQQITPKTTASAITLYSPRVGYRTQAGAAFLSPTLEYFLPSAPSDTVKIEILDEKGAPVNSYRSDAPPPAAGRGGRGGGGGGGDPDDPEAAMMFGRPGGGAAGPTLNVVTKAAGLNRFVWGVQHSSGLGAPPGNYQARLTVGSTTQTVAFTVKMDPRLEAEGVTVADLKEQYQHNSKVRELVSDANAQVARTRQQEARLKGATGAAADTLAKVQELSGKLNTQPVRYGKPGIQAHIQYLSSMTVRVDQKVGRDALSRYTVLKAELDAVKKELDKLFPPKM